MKEIRATLKLRNNRLLSLKESTGWTVPEFCKNVGISTTSYYQFTTMKRSPLTGGDWRDSAKKLAKFAGVDPIELFPEAVQEIQKSGQSTDCTIKLSPDDLTELLPPAMKQLSDPEASAVASELRNKMSEALALLSPREQQVLSLRFGLDGPEKTLEEIGRIQGVGREPIRQIKARALRKLRRPSRIRLLRDFV